MSERQVWVLHVGSWAGTTPGALHYYGRIECQEYDRDAITIERTLDAAGARALQRQERESARYQLSDMSRERAATASYKEGDTTERFTDRDSLVIAAIHTFGEVAQPPAALFTHMGWLTAAAPLASLDDTAVVREVVPDAANPAERRAPHSDLH